jgi:DNA polymerase-3 subunit beta
MNIAVLQENFNLALTSVMHAIEAKPVLPILSTIRLEAQDNVLKVTGANLDWSIDILIGARSYQDGAILLPAKFLSKLVNKMPMERIDMRLNQETSVLTLACGESTSEVKGAAASEYITLKESDGAQTICVDGRIMRAMIEQVIPAAATTDARPILTGVYMRVEGDVLTLAAANGYQSAERTTRLDASYERQDCVVSVAFLQEAARLIKKLDARAIAFRLPVSNRAVTLDIEHNVRLRAQAYEGVYPNYAGVFPGRFASSVTVVVDDLLNAVEMAALAASDAKDKTLFVMADQTITVTGVSPAHGKVSKSVEARLTGDLMSVHLDWTLVKAALKTMPSTRVIMHGNGMGEIVVFSPEGLPELRHLVMPMK